MLCTMKPLLRPIATELATSNGLQAQLRRARLSAAPGQSPPASARPRNMSRNASTARPAQSIVTLRAPSAKSCRCWSEAIAAPVTAPAIAAQGNTKASPHGQAGFARPNQDPDHQAEAHDTQGHRRPCEHYADRIRPIRTGMRRRGEVWCHAKSCSTRCHSAATAINGATARELVVSA